MRVKITGGPGGADVELSDADTGDLLPLIFQDVTIRIVAGRSIEVELTGQPALVNVYAELSTETEEQVLALARKITREREDK